MATAAPAGARRGEPLGLASPRFRRSAATGDMAGFGAGGLKQGKEKEKEKEPRVMYVLSLPATALPAVVSRLEAAVPRRARSSLSRAVPSGWWAYKAAPPVAALVGVATHAPAMNQAPIDEEEGARSPISSSSSRLQRPRVAAAAQLDGSPAAAPAAAAGGRAAKRARRCVRCDAVETPQWRSGPMGRSTLCNACGVRYRAVAALLGHRPAAPPAPEARPAVSSSSSSPPDSPIWEPRHQQPPPSPPDIYLVRKPPPPKKEEAKEKEKEELKLKSKSKSKSEKKKKKRKRAGTSPAPWRNKRKHSCLHCGSSETPQWREGPAGRATLCNACGVRYRQGRLLPEYRPKGSPTFSEAEHAFNHRKVLKLHRHHKDKPQPLPQSQPVHQPNAGEQPVHDAPQEQRNVAAGDQTEEPSSLDSLLLDGPSAPLIVDSDNFLVS